MSTKNLCFGFLMATIVVLSSCKDKEDNTWTTPNYDGPSSTETTDSATDYDGDGFNDQGMYAAFDPLQMVFYFDLWERSSNGPHPTLHYENEGASPEGDLALADEDLRQFLGSLALWK